MKTSSNPILRDILPWLYGGMILWGLIKLGLAALDWHSLFAKNGEKEDWVSRAWTVFERMFAVALIVTGGLLMYFHFKP